MFKGILGLVVVSVLLAITPASAMDMECTDANMTKASADVDKMPDGEKKTMGMKEMTMAKGMMERRDLEGCKTHMNQALEMGMAMSK
jgi:hypothetical protein